MGGPPIDEKPDATGLFADGRFLDFSDLKNRSDRPGNFQNRQQNRLHSMSVTDDGERVYVAGTTAGFYILDTEAIAHHKDAELAAGTAGCNTRSTIVAVDGVIDASRLAALANDCMHMVVNNDPGLKAFLSSNASAQAKAERYLVLLTRSRFDVYPPINATPTGTHSAVFVPDRPAQVKGNTKGRPAYVWLTDENGGCPLNYARMLSVESEITPIMIGAFADSRQPDRAVSRSGEHRAERRAPAAGGPAESQPDRVQEHRVQYLVRTWAARDRYLDPDDASGSRPRPAGSARDCPNLPGLQGRADLLGGQRHRPSCREVHRASE